MGSGPRVDNRLYIRLPVKIVDQHQILELHPKISIVHLPRQKSRRWCTIEFNSKQDLEEVRDALKKLKINKKRIVVKPFRIPDKNTKTKTKYESEELERLLA
ncbi:hypothetical protein ABEB36_006912 [Hypothenemus hampei]|uniref:RRM domain-containing protein n=1 Tax=Hypothenemus hampei TaxID=57062 RepID=A0ABD1ES70_HYPHA